MSSTELYTERASLNLISYLFLLVEFCRLGQADYLLDTSTGGSESTLLCKFFHLGPLSKRFF